MHRMVEQLKRNIGVGHAQRLYIKNIVLHVKYARRFL